MSDADPGRAEGMLREQAWRHHRVWLKRLAASLVVDAARADDVTQQALLAALERPPADATRPRAWLAAVARNLARRFAIGERRRDAREQAAAQDERLPATDEVVARAALQVEVSLAVLELAEPYRSALLLRFFEDLPPRAIARRLGIPAATVRTRVLRGIEQLRERLIARRGAGASRGEPAPGPILDLGLGLVALLDGAARRSVQRALLAKSATSGAAIVGGSAFATLGILGVIGMSTKLKLAVAAFALACGTFAVVKLCELDRSPRGDVAAGTGRGLPPIPAPATADAPFAAPAAATRSAETADVGKPAAEPTSAPPASSICALAGIVRTARGDPAAGVLVLFEDARRAPRFDSLSNLCAGAASLLEGSQAPGSSEAPEGGARTVTAADGRFRFETAPAGASVNVAAIDRDHGMALVPGLLLDGSAATKELELVLAAGVVLHGTVCGEQGAPVAGATVLVMQYSRTKNGSSSSSLLGVATDADGRYRTLPLPFGGFRLTARAAGHFRASDEAFPIAPDERERRVDLRLARAPTWRGAIVTADGGRARLADAPCRYEIVASSTDPTGEITTPDSLGDLGTVAVADDRYELTPDEAGRRFLSLWGDGVLLGVAEIAQPDVAPDLVVDLARLPAPKKIGALAIVVVDARSGAPLPSYVLALTGDPLTLEQPNERDETRHVESADGRVAFEGLLAGSYDVTVRAAGFAPLFANLRVAGPAAASPVRLELRPADARVDGRVEDEDGRPVGRAAIYLLNLDGTAALPAPEHRVVSDAEGRFRFDGVSEGEYLVVASRDPFERLADAQARGGDAEEVDRLDEFAPASARARARLTGATEAAVDETGRAVLKLWRGFEVAVETRCAGKMVMGPFSFRIRDERGAAVHDHHRPSSVTQMSGAGFRFRLAPGDYTIEVFSPQFAPSRTPFRAAPDAHVAVELVPIGSGVTATGSGD